MSANFTSSKTLVILNGLSSFVLFKSSFSTSIVLNSFLFRYNIKNPPNNYGRFPILKYIIIGMQYEVLFQDL